MIKQISFEEAQAKAKSLSEDAWIRMRRFASMQLQTRRIYDEDRDNGIGSSDVSCVAIEHLRHSEIPPKEEYDEVEREYLAARDWAIAKWGEW